MTVTYRTTGRLTAPVNDPGAAMLYLQEHQREAPMAQFIYPEQAAELVVSVTWYLTGSETWAVDVVTEQDLVPEQLAELSEWISGQNSDGLGEGFEQQPFAEQLEVEHDEEEDDEYLYASFDWETNPCTLARVQT